MIMKKFVKLTLIAAAAVAAAACNKETGIETPAGPNVIVFTATLEQPTKADLTQYDVVWSAGDQIAVSNGSTWAVSAALTDADIAEGGRSASFSVAIDPAASYTAVYPASAKSDAALPDGAPADAIMLNLPAAQVIPAGKKIDPAALVQIATTDEPTKLAFKNATSLLEITIPEDGIEAVTFEFLNAAGSKLKVAGDAPVVPVPAATSGKESSVTISGSFAAGEVYYATALPQTGVKSVNLIFSKSGTDCKVLASRTGTGAAEFELPVNGGWKVRNFGTLSWFDGTISTKADLDLWARLAPYYSKDDVIKLAASIDYEGGSWTPVRANAKSGQFSGVFDGQGNCIYNIIINPTEEYSGFFSTLASVDPMERVRDVCFGKNPFTGEYDGVSKLNAASDVVKRLGVVAGYISNCDVVRVDNYIPVTDATTANDVLLGSITGRTGSLVNIIGCNNYGTVECVSTTQTAHYIGGLVGVLDGEGSTIDKCVNYGVVRKTKSANGKGNTFIGGIVSRTGSGVHGLTIRGCVNNGKLGNTGNVQAKQIYVGGILGMDNSSDSETVPNIKILGCTNEIEAIVESSSLSKSTNGAAFGGIIGKASGYSVISGCSNYGTILKSNNHNGITSKFGGIAGMVSGEKVLIQGCDNGSVYNFDYGKVTSTVETKSDSSTEYYGGIAGGFDAGVIRGCSNYANIKTESTETGIVEIAGGIAGQVSGGTLEGCVHQGMVSVAAPHSTCAAGGIIGIMNNAAAYASGTGCKASGSILCGYAGNTGLVVGLYDNTAASSVGSSESPVTVRSSTINGNPVDSSNFGSKLAGSDAGITASGVASGLNTIWAVFQ